MARRGERDYAKERFWRRLLRQWRRSGQTVRDFCAEHGLAEPSFYAWRRIIAERDRQATRHGHDRASDTPAFVPVRLAPTLTAPLEVVLGSGRLLRITPGFDPATLRQLLAVLEEQPSC